MGLLLIFFTNSMGFCWKKRSWALFFINLQILLIITSPAEKFRSCFFVRIFVHDMFRFQRYHKYKSYRPRSQLSREYLFSQFWVDTRDIWSNQVLPRCPDCMIFFLFHKTSSFVPWWYIYFSWAFGIRLLDIFLTFWALMLH